MPTATLLDFFGFSRKLYTPKRKHADSFLEERPAKRALTGCDVPFDPRIERSKIPNVIFKLPNEIVHTICTLTQDEDLRNLLLVNHKLASIASSVYGTRLGIRKEAGSHTIALEGESYRALGAWKRSTLFTYSKHAIQLYCAIGHDNRQLAAAQVCCLHTFLSTDFPTTPFSSVVINGVCHLNPAVIVEFIRLIDKAGCRYAAMMSSYDFNKYSIAATTPPCPPVKLSNLTHLELHTPHFTDQEWSQILRCLTGSKLISLSILGPPPFIPLFRFMARHPNLESLEAYSHWAHFDGTPPSGVPQRIVQMPHLESLNGPPCHLQIILKSLSHVPETLSLHFRPDRAQSYSEFVTQIMETVRLCDGIDSNLNVTIHFRERHFALEHDYKFDVHAMQALGLNCPGAKSLYLFLPAMKEEDVEDICTQWLYLWPVLAGMQVHVNPPKPGLTVDLAVNQYRLGWATSSSTGDTAVIKWEDSNTMSKC